MSEETVGTPIPEEEKPVSPEAECPPLTEEPAVQMDPAEDDLVTEEVAAAEVPEETPSEEAPPQEPEEAGEIPYHERYYLRYRQGLRTTALDLEGTRAFLTGAGFDGGELRQARNGRKAPENPRSKTNLMHCSYCGAEIAGVEFYRFPDGRMRCTTCSSTVVKTKREMEALCRKVIANMDNFFGATIDVPVSIEVADGRKLKRRMGIPLGTKDDQSTLILGVAINKKQNYSIMLENGAPRISLIATFAHELTHIWQYTHWDNRKDFRQCPPGKRLLVYEGMAKWAEIQYLYLMGETSVARREEYITRNRDDAYGRGFCLYEERFPLTREAMVCEDTPFTSGRYPFD